MNIIDLALSSKDDNWIIKILNELMCNKNGPIIINNDYKIEKTKRHCILCGEKTTASIVLSVGSPMGFLNAYGICKCNNNKCKGYLKSFTPDIIAEIIGGEPITRALDSERLQELTNKRMNLVKKYRTLK